MYKAAERCQETIEGGYSTLGMSMCNRAETIAWDLLLNTEYQETTAFFKLMDDDDKVHFPEFAKRVESLRKAQRAWIAWRDAECSSIYSEFGAGSLRHILGSGCHLQMTPERAIDLWAKREGMQ